MVVFDKFIVEGLIVEGLVVEGLIVADRSGYFRVRCVG
jgi:hypothetical protein